MTGAVSGASRYRALMVLHAHWEAGSRGIVVEIVKYRIIFYGLQWVCGRDERAPCRVQTRYVLFPFGHYLFFMLKL